MLQGKVSKHLRIRNSIPESIHCQTLRIVRKLVLRLIVSTELYKISLIKHSLLMIQNVLKLLRILKVHFEMNTMDPHQNLVMQVKSQILMLRMQQTFLTTRQICIMMLLVERLQVLSNLMDMMGMVCLSLMNQLLLQQVLLLHHQLMIPYSLKLM